MRLKDWFTQNRRRLRFIGHYGVLKQYRVYKKHGKTIRHEGCGWALFKAGKPVGIVDNELATVK